MVTRPGRHGDAAAGGVERVGRGGMLFAQRAAGVCGGPRVGLQRPATSEHVSAQILGRLDGWMGREIDRNFIHLSG